MAWSYVRGFIIPNERIGETNEMRAFCNLPSLNEQFGGIDLEYERYHVHDGDEPIEILLDLLQGWNDVSEYDSNQICNILHNREIVGKFNLSEFDLPFGTEGPILVDVSLIHRGYDVKTIFNIYGDLRWFSDYEKIEKWWSLMTMLFGHDASLTYTTPKDTVILDGFNGKHVIKDKNILTE